MNVLAVVQQQAHTHIPRVLLSSRMVMMIISSTGGSGSITARWRRTGLGHVNIGLIFIDDRRRRLFRRRVVSFRWLELVLRTTVVDLIRGMGNLTR